MGQLVISKEAKEKVIPLSKSRSGCNMHSFSCESTGRIANYVVCQHTVLAFKDKRLGANSFVDCQGCIGSSKCLAVRMMIAERKAGRALFYEEYVPKTVEVDVQPVVVSKSWRSIGRQTNKVSSANKVNKANNTNKASKPNTLHKDDKPNIDASNMFADMVSATD
ncbi:hypothetical protein C9I92_21730 [Photobacterium ganghwense]|uniref:hypothetical protein n=1 Tax=Photobacterium ganghwense TaxID=320778 RepID=UPI00069F0E1D|nr:hypothetical protein [Photobacterium ganghwense]PSU05411.1 hypothetical protein C9I92_21730 [Photobacterium ganghwense]QSV17214.1 hypothetical protein FH974_19950 [Photobacterium ganghwense]